MGEESIETENEKIESRYKKINKIPLGDLKPNEGIIPNNWYIVYEKTLLEPKIINYPFKEQYFASRYVHRFLSKRPTHIIQGKDLINIGFQKALGRVTGNKHQGKGNFQHHTSKYGFDKSLSRQRKKSLRTFYRRQLRRRLIKLLNNGNKNKERG